MDATVAIAQESDLPALVALAAEFRDHLGQQEPSLDNLTTSFRALLVDPGTEFFIARTPAGDAVGYIQCRYRYSAWTSGLDAELEDVFVSARARRRGIGKQLMEYALSRASEKQCRLVGLNTNERNEPARLLYEGLGFRADRDVWQAGRQLWLEKRLANRA
ncbi:MAG: GNAT family N-acetyltransferase [Candidatus Binataceae bacterium]